MFIMQDIYQFLVFSVVRDGLATMQDRINAEAKGGWRVISSFTNTAGQLVFLLEKIPDERKPSSEHG